MPSFDLIPLLVQTGYAGLFISLLIYVLREQAKREMSWRDERDERHRELVSLQRETLSALNGLRLVMQQFMDQSKPPFVEERRHSNRPHSGPDRRRE